MKKIICLLLSLVMLISLVPTSVMAEGSELNWDEPIKEYEYNSRKVAIYRNDSVNEMNQFTTILKFVVMSKNKTVEYVTTPYCWSLTTDERLKYDSDTQYKAEKNEEVFTQALQQDDYLTLGFGEMSGKKKQLKAQGVSAICLNCVNSCKVREGCFSCKGEIKQYSKRKYICLECNKKRYLSLTKDVCSNCKSQNYITIKGLWQTTTDWNLEDVDKYFDTSFEQLVVQGMLEQNWTESANETIRAARDLSLDWDTASKLYQNAKLYTTEDYKAYAKHKSIITSAVYENQKFVANEFSQKTTKELHSKYHEMLGEFLADVLIGYFTEMSPITVDDKVMDVAEKIYTWKIEEYKKALETNNSNDAIQEDVTNVTDEETDKNNSVDKKKILDIVLEKIEKKIEDYNSESISEICSEYEILELLETAYSECGDKAAFAEEIGKEITDLWFTLEDDFTDYYKEYSYLVNSSVAKKSAMNRLCEDIVLAAALKNALN